MDAVRNTDAIQIEGLTKSFGTVQALRGLSMAVEQGTVCGFIGPNGAGKTTTLRILLGLLPRDGGTVRLLGQDVVFGTESHSQNRLSYLPQDPVFPERHTGIEVMQLTAGLYGMKPRDAGERSETLLKEFHLWDARKHGVGTYSRGMKQRLGLAACFLPEPELLLLDEPVSALDPEGRLEVFDLLKRLKGKATVLFSSHILEDVERVSDKLVMVKAGQSVMEGPMADILDRFASDKIRIAFRSEDAEQAKAALKAMPWVAGVSGDAETATGHERTAADGAEVVIYVDIKPSMMAAALDETLVCLVQRGLRVREFGRSKTDLEEVFLRFNA